MPPRQFTATEISQIADLVEKDCPDWGDTYHMQIAAEELGYTRRYSRLATARAKPIQADLIRRGRGAASTLWSGWAHRAKRPAELTTSLALPLGGSDEPGTP